MYAPIAFHRSGGTMMAAIGTPMIVAIAINSSAVGQDMPQRMYSSPGPDSCGYQMTRPCCCVRGVPHAQFLDAALHLGGRIGRRSLEYRVAPLT